MALNKRERNLVILTVTIVVLGLNYLLIVPMWRRWQNTQGELATQRRELVGMKSVISKVPVWQRDYDALREGLGKTTFSETSDVLKKIEEVGVGSGIVIVTRRPQTAVDKGVYRELPLQCTFEATTESLVKFLHGVQTSSGFMNVEQLQIAPKADNPNILRCDISIRALSGKMEKRAS